MIYFSFKRTLLDFFNKVINPTPDDKFVFSCRRSRVLSQEIPGYVALLENRNRDNSETLKAEELQPEVLEAWYKLRTILEEADIKGNIKFLFDENGQPFDSNIDLCELYYNTPQWQRHGLD